MARLNATALYEGSHEIRVGPHHLRVQFFRDNFRYEITGRAECLVCEGRAQVTIDAYLLMGQAIDARDFLHRQLFREMGDGGCIRISERVIEFITNAIVTGVWGDPPLGIPWSLVATIAATQDFMDIEKGEYRLPPGHPWLERCPPPPGGRVGTFEGGEPPAQKLSPGDHRASGNPWSPPSNLPVETENAHDYDPWTGVPYKTPVQQQSSRAIADFLYYMKWSGSGYSWQKPSQPAPAQPQNSVQPPRSEGQSDRPGNSSS